MCRMCDGFSLEEVIAEDAAHIDEHGYVIIAVEGRGNHDASYAPWAYTVGLRDRADHPELIVAGLRTDLGGAFLSDIAATVLDDDDRYAVGDSIDLGPAGIATVGAVHPVQYELDTFNMWHNLAAFGAVQTQALEAVQLLLPADLCCPVHRLHQPVLADPRARVGGPASRPNRATRRSRARRPRRPKGRG